MRLQRPDKAEDMQEVQETKTSAHSAAALSLPARQEDASVIHTSVCVSIRQHTSACLSLPESQKVAIGLYAIALGLFICVSRSLYMR
jgi:hypothetical protein